MKYNEYNERKQHGSPEFPMQLYCVDHTHPQYVMPLHWHKELEIIRILSGTMLLSVNHLSYSMHAGDIALIGCGYLHHGNPSDCRYECIVCDLSMLAPKSSYLHSTYLDPLILSTVALPVLSPELPEEISQSIHQLFEIFRKKAPFYELRTAGQLLNIIGLLYQRQLIRRTSEGVLPTQYHRITQLIQWIERNCAEPLTLTQLSRRSGFTPNYLCRIFKEYTGKTPTEYINSIRIEHVCHDLRGGAGNITEVARQNGFNDISYFCKVFKKHKGISAGQYLKEDKNAGSSNG